MKTAEIPWDEDILSKYNVSGPRYTSYPTALEFSDDHKLSDYIRCLNLIPEENALSLYLHIPFCENICYYCACNKIITKDKHKLNKYVDYLIKEIRLIAKQTGSKTLRQIHWGGGTPTYLSMQQIASIMATIRECFEVHTEPPAEISIEVDPRSLPIEDVKKLAVLGFNRMSLGVQDFDEQVQRTINRVQSFEMVNELVIEARLQGFTSINLDLIYGLPYQTLDTIKATFDQVIKISPDRISIFNYAHLPSRFKAQGLINSLSMPGLVQKLKIFEYIINRLLNSDFISIGMDHFAKADDELAIAQKNNRLHRNFQGYTTHKEYDLIGVGVSSIGSIGNQYHQNVRDLKSYYSILDKDEIPSWRGINLTADDELRKAVIFELICHFKLSKKAFESAHDINFDHYFKKELTQLNEFIEDGLVKDSSEYLLITHQGRLLVRNICMVFDAYIKQKDELKNFSRII